MKKAIQLLSVAVILIAGASCKKINADGPVITKTVDLRGFTAVSCSVDAIVTHTQSPDYHVEIHAQQAILDKMRVEVVDGELRFYYPGAINIGRHDQITINVAGPKLRGFSINGSGELRGGDVNVGNETVHLKISGSGSAYFTSVNAQALEAEVAGSGNMTVASGSVLRESTEISGSGDIDFNNVPADDVTARISGSGSIHTYASKTLDVHISGSGNVYYRGTPRVTTSISGSGKLQAR